MYRKMGAHVTPVLQNSVRFHFESLPLKVRTFQKAVELAGFNEEEKQDFYEFSVTLKHPCLEYTMQIKYKMSVESFEKGF